MTTLTLEEKRAVLRSVKSAREYVEKRLEDDRIDEKQYDIEMSQIDEFEAKIRAL